MRFLFVDKILKMDPGGVTLGVKHVTPEDQYLTLDPVRGQSYFIPSLVGETLGQLAAWNVMFACDFKKRPVAGIVGSVTFIDKVYVGQSIFLESTIDHLDDKAVHYHSVAYVDEKPVFKMDGALGPLLPMQDFIDEALVKNQYEQIARFSDTIPDLKTRDTLMPYDGTMSNMRFGFDTILECIPNTSITAEKRVNACAPYFPSHFPNKPVLPMSVLLECQLGLVAYFLEQSNYSVSYRVDVVQKIKMSDFIQPGDTARCYMRVKMCTEENLILQLRTDVEGRRVCILEVVLKAQGHV